MSRLGNILPLLGICLFLVLSCGQDEARVIPRAKLAEIYAEMLMTDQWVSNTPAVRRMADTSLVYEPILQKYGYNSADYRKSVDVYLNDPERFSRILRTSAEILDARLAALNVMKEERDHQRALEKLLQQLKYEADFKAEDFFPYLFDEPYVHYYDSLSVAPDSTLMIYRLKNIERTDTIFDGIRMTVNDTLSVQDTMAVTDTLKSIDEKTVE